MTVPTHSSETSQQQLSTSRLGLAESELFFLFDSLLELATPENSAQNAIESPDRISLAEQFLSGLSRVLGCQGAGLYQQAPSPEQNPLEWTKLASIGGRSLGKPEENWLKSSKPEDSLLQVRNYPAQNWGQVGFSFFCALVSDSPCLLVLSSRNPEAFSRSLFEELKPLLEKFCQLLARLSLQEGQTFQAQQQNKHLHQLLKTENLRQFLEQISVQCSNATPQTRCAIIVRPQVTSPDYVLDLEENFARPLSKNLSKALEDLSAQTPPISASADDPATRSFFQELWKADLLEEKQSSSICQLSIFPLNQHTDTIPAKQVGSWQGWLVFSTPLHDSSLQKSKSNPPASSSIEFHSQLAEIVSLKLKLEFLHQQQLTGSILPATTKTFSFPDSAHAQNTGKQTAWKNLHHKAEQLSQTNLPILLTGEPGTGKSQLAEWIHHASQQSQGLFKALTCKKLTPAQLEKSLAVSQHEPVKLETIFSSQNFVSTLFLDNVEQLPSETQQLLLKHLLEAQPAVPRLLASANAPLSPLVEQGKFLGALENALCQTQLSLPSLRQIPEELPNLIQFVACQQGHEISDLATLITPEGLEFLERFPWPGNLTQLENLIVMICRELPVQPLSRYDLELFLTGPGIASTSQSLLGLTEATLQFQREYIRQVIARCGGNMTEAARTLDLHRSNLYRKMRQLEMSEAEQEENEHPS